MQVAGRSLAEYLGLTSVSTPVSASGDGLFSLPPELVLKLHEGSNTVTLSQIQQLILWVAGEGVNPTWIFVKNKLMIPSVVLVLVDELSLHFASQNPLVVSPIPSSFHSLQLKFHGSSFDKFAVTRGIHFCPGSILPRKAPAPSVSSTASQPALKKRKIDDDSSPKSPPTREDSFAHNVKLVEGLDEEKFLVTVSEQTKFFLSKDQLAENNYPVKLEEAVEWNGNSRLVQYVETKSSTNPASKRVVAMDCEMCITDRGYELTRLTLVDFDESVLIDMLVVPGSPITDHNTRYAQSSLLCKSHFVLFQIQRHY
jgi:RNA exonuclease 1